MKKTFASISFLFICLFSISVFGFDDDPFTLMLKKLTEYAKKLPAEKVYLHLDKPYYAAGDDIWFKAYVVDSKTNAPTTISNILYVELIDNQDQVVKLLKLQMQGGLANGDFNLPDTFKEGNYRIRAYTQWMRNAGPDYFFDKTLKIGSYWNNLLFAESNYVANGETTKGTIKFSDNNGNPLKNAQVSYEIRLNDKNTKSGRQVTNADGAINITFPTQNAGNLVAIVTMPNKAEIQRIIPIKIRQKSIDMQLLPEGGNLIEGLPCKVAIKAISNLGLGEDVKGVVVDNIGTEVLSFETSYLGMGFFMLNPEAGKTYQARVTTADGIQRSFPLPTAQKSGYQLAINEIDTSKIAVKVMMSTDLVNKGSLQLLAQRNGNIAFTAQIATDKQISLVTIPKNSFPSGIIQFTLFNGDLPVSERMVFIKNLSQQIDLKLSNLNETYAKKANVNLNVLATNNSTPVQGSFSVSVTNADIVTPDFDYESNIFTGLLLRSELNGYIEKPNHYFLKNDAVTLSRLDNLMLTQGWRKIDWKNISQPALETPKFQAEKGMSISGRVTRKGQPIVKGKISLLTTTKTRMVASTETDENGRFSFDDSIFGDSLTFALQASTKENKKEVKVEMDNVPGQIVTTNANTGDIIVNVNSSINTYIKESSEYFEELYKTGFLNKTNLLKTVNIVQKISRFDSASVNSSNLNGRGRANAIITANDLKNTYDLYTYFRSGRVMGVGVDQDGYVFNTRGGGRMSISIDGFVMSEVSIETITIEDVESIEVLRGSPYTMMYGSDGYNGVLVITLQRGSGRKMSSIYAPGLVVFMPKGYDMPRKFYSPKYDAVADNRQDKRTTVYWNPDVMTNASGMANINYFNTSQKGNYRVVIEGIDANGNLARKVATYTVN